MSHLIPILGDAEASEFAVPFTTVWMVCKSVTHDGSGQDWDSSDFPITSVSPLGGGELEADDALYAASYGASGDSSSVLKCTNFDGITTEVAAGATILGFEIRARRFRAYLNSWTVDSTTVKFVKAGSVVGSDIGSGFTWPDAEAAQTIGSSTELGGQTWTAAEVRSSSFGCAFTVNWTTGIGTETDPEIFIDLVEMRVHGEA